jgi:hypothetical protein
MKASKLFVAVAAVVFAGSAFAADVPVASAATAAAAGQVAYASSVLNVPVVVVTKSTGRTRAQVHAEAVEAVRNHRSTFAIQMDFLKG